MFGLEALRQDAALQDFSGDPEECVTGFYEASAALESLFTETDRHTHAVKSLERISTVLDEESELSAATCMILNDGLCGLVPTLYPGKISASTKQSLKSAMEGVLGDFWESVKAFFKMLWEKLDNFIQWLFSSNTSGAASVSQAKEQVKAILANPASKQQAEEALKTTTIDAPEASVHIKFVTDSRNAQGQFKLRLTEFEKMIAETEALVNNMTKPGNVMPVGSKVKKPDTTAPAAAPVSNTPAAPAKKEPLVVPEKKTATPEQLGYNLEELAKLPEYAEKLQDPSFVQLVKNGFAELKAKQTAVVQHAEQAIQQIEGNNEIPNEEKHERVGYIREGITNIKLGLVDTAKAAAECGHATKEAVKTAVTVVGSIFKRLGDTIAETVVGQDVTKAPNIGKGVPAEQPKKPVAGGAPPATASP